MLEANIKISVIIPVYNVENYLHECIDSVLNQDYTNLEVILINDGSTDTSGLICNNYAVKDQRVKVLHQQNQGVAAARNLGLKYTTGDYISFIDSDDWIDQGMYSDIANKIKQSRSSIDVFYMPYPGRKDIDKTIYNEFEIKSQLLPLFLGTHRISLGQMASVWSLCIRREIIKDISFYNISVVEDKPFFIEVLAKANNLVILTQKYYNYRINTASLIRNYHKEYIHSVTVVHKIIPEILEKYAKGYPELITLNNNTIVSFYYHSIKNELRNKNLNNDLSDARNNIQQYYTNNNMENLLTWKRTLRVSVRNPKWILIKLGYTNSVIKILWNRNKRALKQQPNLQYLPQS